MEAKTELIVFRGALSDLFYIRMGSKLSRIYRFWFQNSSINDYFSNCEGPDL